MNADQIAALPAGHLMRTMLDAPLDGRVLLRFRSPSPPLPGRYPDLGDALRHAPERSFLSLINPAMKIFERTGSWSTGG